MSKLKPITVILTASGCPGASTCIRHLKKVTERKVRVLGVDSSSECVGRFFADGFRQVPNADEPEYIDALLLYAVEEKADCILVASSYEVEVLATHRKKFEDQGIVILASSQESLKIANNKRNLYELFEHNPNVKVPGFKIVTTLDEFVFGCNEMGYPSRDLCFKPPFSKGSRGFRYLASGIDRADLLMNYKPDSKIITLDEMCEIFRGRNDFPELILMETVEGEEIDSMVIALDGDVLLTTHKTREIERGGVITQGGHCERPLLDGAIVEILSKVHLSYNVGIQFKNGYLMEINPRLSTFMYAESWNEPYFAIRLALGEMSLEEVSNLQAKVPKDIRMIRYFDQVFFETLT
jgi:carbamoyl-phosphate synthase large subunit